MKLLKLKDPIIEQEYDSIFIIINKFIKWGYFIAYIKEVFLRYGVPDKIILDRDTRFILVF